MPNPVLLNDAQMACLEHYAHGAYRPLAECTDRAEFWQGVRACGDPLLGFLLVEFAESEDCRSIEDAQLRLSATIGRLKLLSSQMALQP